MATTADEEDAINELLAGLRPPEPEASPPPPPLDERASAALKKQHVDELTDKKVFDTACGGEGTWMLSCTRQDVDFLEERGDGWACCVSVVMSLYRADGSLMHDEVGTHAHKACMQGHLQIHMHTYTYMHDDTHVHTHKRSLTRVKFLRFLERPIC